jgi:hypothetical protein
MLQIDQTLVRAITTNERCAEDPMGAGPEAVNAAARAPPAFIIVATATLFAYGLRERRAAEEKKAARKLAAILKS